jgi:lipopolysaccharide transport system permease protein
MEEVVISEKKWTEVIEPRNRLFNLHLAEVWHYRDLLFMWVKRDFAATYKQTILEPLWFFIQPVLTTIMFIPWCLVTLPKSAPTGNPKSFFTLQD